MAAFTRGLWRFIGIPHSILCRSFEAQRGWVAWRIRRHYKEEKGECALFGRILGYVWVRSKESRIHFDVWGHFFPTCCNHRKETFVVSLCMPAQTVPINNWIPRR